MIGYLSEVGFPSNVLLLFRRYFWKLHLVFLIDGYLEFSTTEEIKQNFLFFFESLKNPRFRNWRFLFSYRSVREGNREISGEFEVFSIKRAFPYLDAFLESVLPGRDRHASRQAIAWSGAKRNRLGKRLMNNGGLVLVILAFSLPLFWFGFSNLVSFLRVSNWESVPVTLHHLDLDDPESRVEDRGEARVDARYTYHYRGRQYTGTSFDNLPAGYFGSDMWWLGFMQRSAQEARWQIQNYLDENKHYCYINPKHPNESVLVKRIHQYTGHCISFALIGLHLCFLVLFYQNLKSLDIRKQKKKVFLNWGPYRFVGIALLSVTIVLSFLNVTFFRWMLEVETAVSITLVIYLLSLLAGVQVARKM